MPNERISIIAPAVARLPSGGAKTYYVQANALAERGYDVTVVHSLNFERGVRGRLIGLLRGKVRDFRAGNLRRRVSWLPIDERVRMHFVPNLDDRAVLPPADLRIATYWQTSEFLADRGARNGASGPASMQLIQAYETWAGPTDRVEATWRLPIHTAVVSQSLYDRGLALGVPADRLHLVPNGIDSDIFRLRAPIAGRAPCVAFLAHQMPVKGLKEAIETLEIVHRERPDARLIAFGGAPRPPQLPAFIEYRRRLLGLELAEQVYDRCSVFLCASQSEGFGFPSLEAMACGAALVSTSNGGVDDFAIDGESALIRPVGDTSGLAEAVLTLLSDEPMRARLAAAGAVSASRFTWQGSTAAFERAVRAALDVPVG